ncbi:hypothetical protein F5148DRAFT_990587, partial [Russula earlei]
EEHLIDFQELIGAHLGKNMAEVVWETLELYRLKGRIITITMDNASNNNTMMTTLEACCYAEGIRLSARDSRMRCMPHTIHLAAFKLRN